MNTFTWAAAILAIAGMFFAYARAFLSLAKQRNRGEVDE